VRLDGALDNPLYVLPFNQIILNIKTFLHPGPGPPFPKCWNRVACIRMSNESITTEVVVILLFASDLRRVQQFVHIAKTLCARFQPLASHSLNKQTHSDYSFGSTLMKKDLKYLQHFNQKIAQWEPKTCLQKASVDNNLIFFRSRGGAVPSNPHNRHLTKVYSFYGVNLTLFDGRLSEDGMAWPPGPVFRIFIPTFHIIVIAIVRIFRQIRNYFFVIFSVFVFAIDS
jgi:hypothetical protein